MAQSCGLGFCASHRPVRRQGAASAVPQRWPWGHWEHELNGGRDIGGFGDVWPLLALGRGDHNISD